MFKLKGKVNKVILWTFLIVCTANALLLAFAYRDFSWALVAMAFASVVGLPLNIYFLIKKINPDLLHLITIKPVIYGGIISRLIQIKGVVSAVPGLGYVYISKGIRAAILRFFINYF